MCLSTSALILFVSLLPQEIVTPGEHQIIISAETGNVSWENFEGEWCTVAPYLEASSSK